MRFYAVGNMYLSSIQQGIQAAHCVAEMIVHRSSYEVIEWAEKHKTIICLNGGNNQSLNDFAELVSMGPYPTAKFYEDEASLGGMLTCVGVIVPARIYETDLTEIDAALDVLTPWEFNLASVLKRMPLAR